MAGAWSAEELSLPVHPGRLIGADADTVSYAFAGAAPWTPTVEQFAAFTGRYRSDEVPATWTVKVENGRLVASPRTAESITLIPSYPDAFVAGGGLGVIWFIRDVTGAVTAMHSGAARVWDIAFRKEK